MLRWEETEEVSSEKEAALHCSLHLITLLSLRRCSQLRWHDWRALIIKGALAANTECSYLGERERHYQSLDFHYYFGCEVFILNFSSTLH